MQIWNKYKILIIAVGLILLLVVVWSLFQSACYNHVVEQSQQQLQTDIANVANSTNAVVNATIEREKNKVEIKAATNSVVEERKNVQTAHKKSTDAESNFNRIANTHTNGISESDLNKLLDQALSNSGPNR